jgi:hypothetical protein
MKKRFPKISASVAPMLLVCGLLAPFASARADSDRVACSNHTIQGDYGFSVEGVVFPGGGATFTIRGVHMTHFDGKGNLTEVDHILVYPVAFLPNATDWVPVTGSYHINADCTGTINLLPSTGGFVNLTIVVVKKGREIHTVVTAPFDGPDRTVTSVGIKVE